MSREPGYPFFAWGIKMHYSRVLAKRELLIEVALREDNLREDKRANKNKELPVVSLWTINPNDNFHNDDVGRSLSSRVMLLKGPHSVHCLCGAWTQTKQFPLHAAVLCMHN